MADMVMAAGIDTPRNLDLHFSDLEQSARRGWAFDDEERYVAMRCVAAPIFHAQGTVIAGVSVSGPTLRFPDHAIGEIGPTVRRAAARITERMGGTAQAPE